VKASLATFALYYVLGTAFVAAIAYLVRMNAHISASFVVLLVAAHVTVHRFIADNGRVFHKKEKWWLAIGSLAIVVGLALATPAVLFLLRDGVPGLNRFLTQVGSRTLAQWSVTLLVWVLEFVLLLVMYGWWARKYAVKMGKPKPA